MRPTFYPGFRVRLGRRVQRGPIQRCDDAHSDASGSSAQGGNGLSFCSSCRSSLPGQRLVRTLGLRLAVPLAFLLLLRCSPQRRPRAGARPGTASASKGGRPAGPPGAATAGRPGIQGTPARPEALGAAPAQTTPPAAGAFATAGRPASSPTTPPATDAPPPQSQSSSAS